MDIKQLLQLSDDSQKDFNDQISKELEVLEKDIEELRISTFLSGEYDDANAILDINAGAGGTEACDWANMLMRMYQRWAEKKGFDFKILDILPGEEAGIKNVSVIISGEFTYGILKGEKGVHRLVRISPFDANKRRHTSFASVNVMPEIQSDIEVEMAPEDLEIETFRASGPGGQHVNVTDSAVRIRHIPTGIVVACQNERSQHQNRRIAMQLLRAKLFEKKQKEQEEKLKQMQGIKRKIEWGSQIRSYILQPYMLVKDHRTNVETSNAEAVLDGEIDIFLRAFLNWKAQTEIKGG